MNLLLTDQVANAGQFGSSQLQLVEVGRHDTIPNTIISPLSCWKAASNGCLYVAKWQHGQLTCFERLNSAELIVSLIEIQFLRRRFRPHDIVLLIGSNSFH
jgi:hypothetical protein